MSNVGEKLPRNGSYKLRSPDDVVVVNPSKNVDIKKLESQQHDLENVLENFDKSLERSVSGMYVHIYLCICIVHECCEAVEKHKHIVCMYHFCIFIFRIFIYLAKRTNYDWKMLVYVWLAIEIFALCNDTRCQDRTIETLVSTDIHYVCDLDRNIFLFGFLDDDGCR